VGPNECVFSPEIDGSTQSLLVNSESCKKGKTWTLLKMFDREKKLKDEGAGTLHGVLCQIKPSEFKVQAALRCNARLVQDAQLARLAPFSWGDFVDFMKAERAGRRKSRRVGDALYLCAMAVRYQYFT
jgi:hypothetical protein